MIGYEVAVESYAEFHEVIARYDSRQFLFRGVARTTYDLIPRIGRTTDRLHEDLYQYETELMTLFKRNAIPYLTTSPSNEWEWLAIAQHHGLPTRLLDWSRNPIVAAFFAVQESLDEDAVIYALNTGQETLQVATEFEFEPYVYDENRATEVKIYEPDHIIPRIVVQKGCFTVHSDPTLPLNLHPEIFIDRIVIRSHFRKTLKRTLDSYGINTATLFPGLDGLCSYLDWYTRKIV